MSDKNPDTQRKHFIPLYRSKVGFGSGAVGATGNDLPLVPTVDGFGNQWVVAVATGSVSGLPEPTRSFANNADNVPTVANGLLGVASFPFAFDGATEDRLRTASVANIGALSGIGALIVSKPGDWSITNAPAANVIATITRAAIAGVSHVCTSITGALVGTAAATPAATLVLRDGATGVGAIIWSGVHIAGAGFADEISLSDLNIVGTPGNAMTLEWTAAPGAGNFQSVALTGHDVS